MTLTSHPASQTIGLLLPLFAEQKKGVLAEIMKRQGYRPFSYSFLHACELRHAWDALTLSLRLMLPGWRS
jgi:hypothetical protein